MNCWPRLRGLTPKGLHPLWQSGYTRPPRNRPSSVRFSSRSERRMANWFSVREAGCCRPSRSTVYRDSAEIPSRLNRERSASGTYTSARPV